MRPATHSEYAQWFVWVVDVKVVDESRDRDGEEVGALPEAAHLLVLHLRAHLELTTREKKEREGKKGERRRKEERCREERKVGEEK